VRGGGGGGGKREKGKKVKVKKGRVNYTEFQPIRWWRKLATPANRQEERGGGSV